MWHRVQTKHIVVLNGLSDVCVLFKWRLWSLWGVIGLISGKYLEQWLVHNNCSADVCYWHYCPLVIGSSLYTKLLTRGGYESLGIGLNQDGFVLTKCQKWDVSPASQRKTWFPSVPCPLADALVPSPAIILHLMYLKLKALLKRKLTSVYSQVTAVISSGAMLEGQMVSKWVHICNMSEDFLCFLCSRCFQEELGMFGILLLPQENLFKILCKIVCKSKIWKLLLFFLWLIS